MNCDELLAFLNDYVDGAADLAICEQFEKHLAGCRPCRVVIDNVRKTITVFKNGEPYPLPAQVRERLHAFLRDRWKEKYSASNTQK